MNSTCGLFKHTAPFISYSITHLFSIPELCFVSSVVRFVPLFILSLSCHWAQGLSPLAAAYIRSSSVLSPKPLKSPFRNDSCSLQQSHFPCKARKHTQTRLKKEPLLFAYIKKLNADLMLVNTNACNHTICAESLSLLRPLFGE